ncbi:C4-dicarboxylate TRAP transporter substrate-binding protein [Pararhodobacter oceanensis]|uniref:C4-dicarboxylate TRAP transporter substrate-binding protein n=1 Tax=Pararhodobacter oceanensis TaxID=2172121 RepID=UPI003A934C07
MTMKLNRRTLLASTAASAGLACFGLPAAAAGRMATVIDGYPERSMWLVELSNFFLPEVNRRLEEAGLEVFDFQESYGGSIVNPRGVLEGLRLGLGDMGIVTTIFHASELPSQAIAAVTPFISSNAAIVARAIDEIANEFPDMREEFASENQVYLATGVVLDSYQMFSTRPINTLADMADLRVAGAGYNLRYLEGLDGAVGVRGGLTDFYNMVQTGVTEAAMLWPEAANTFAIAEVAPHMLRANLGSVNTKSLTVNADFWATLSPEVQAVLQEVAIDYRDRMAEVAMEQASVSEAAFVEAGGTITDLSDADRAAWAAAMPNIAQEWAQGLDDAGKNGSAMLDAYINKLIAAGETPARNWSTEA